MALTINTQPASNVFQYAGDPLLFELETDLTSDPDVRCTAQVAMIMGTTYSSAKIYVPKDAANLFTFNLRKYASDLFKFKYPSFPSPTSNVVLSLQYNFALTAVIFEELSSDPLVTSDTVSSNYFYLLRGGTAWEQFPTLDYLNGIQSSTLAFLTLNPRPLKADLTNPLWVSFLLLSSASTFDVNIEAFDDAGVSLGTFTAFTAAAYGTSKIFSIPAGFIQTGLSAQGYASSVAYYTLQVLDGATALSELLQINVDRSYHRNQRHFIWLNSQGGTSQISLYGESQINLETEQLVVTKSQPYTNYVAQGQQSVEDLQLMRSIKANSGHSTHIEVEALADLMASQHVLEIVQVQTPAGTQRIFLPIIKTTQNLNLKTDDQYMPVFNLEYKYAFKSPYYSG